MSNDTSSKSALFLALGLVMAGVILGLVGFRLIGGLVAGGGAIPSLYGAWKGMQQETQTGLAASLGVMFLSLGAGALLIVWKVVGAIF